MPSQRTAIDRHLIRCKRCSDLIASYQSTVAALALAVPLVSPPASARTALLMTRIAETPQTRGSTPSVYAGSLETFRTPTLPSSVAVSGRWQPAAANSDTAWWKVYAAPLATLPLHAGAGTGERLGIQQLRATP